MSLIYLDQPNINASDFISIGKALKQGVSTASSTVNEFEKQMAEYLGVFDAIATNSGTSALHLALIGAKIKPGDEIILPVTTFVATANVIRYVGAIPVFADIDPKTWCIDSEQIPKLYTKKTKAIIGVNLYGVHCNWFDIEDYSDYLDLCTIEDASQSLGSIYDYGTLSWWQCFSFNGNKTMTAGGGGALTTRTAITNKTLYTETPLDKCGYSIANMLSKLKNLSIQAKNQDGTHNAIGYNYRMIGLSASLGISQLKRLDEFVEKKRTFNKIYREKLPFLQFQEATEHSEPCWWMTACLFPGGTNIEKVRSKLQSKGIPTRRIFRPLTDSLPYMNNKKYPVAIDIYERGLCLPSSTLNTKENIYRVCGEIRKLL